MPIPKADRISPIALSFVIFSPKNMRPNSAVNIMTTDDNSGNCTDASIVTMQRSENSFPNIFDIEKVPENKIKKKYNFDVIFSFPIFQNAFLNESLSPFAIL